MQPPNYQGNPIYAAVGAGDKVQAPSGNKQSFAHSTRDRADMKNSGGKVQWQVKKTLELVLLQICDQRTEKTEKIKINHLKSLYPSFL